MMKRIDIHAHLLYDPIHSIYSVDHLLQDMMENDIEFRVVSALEGSSIKHQNDTVIAMVRKHPSLIGCAIINPREVDALEEVKRVLQYDEIKMLEFNSLIHAYRPEEMDYVLDDIFELCTSTKKIIKVFSGHGFLTVPDQWAYYAKRYPELLFIIEHMGGSDFSYGTIDLVKEVSNMVLDTSYETELQVLRRAFKELPNDILFFGSNYPQNHTDLAIMKYHAIEMSEETKQKLFYDNAKKMLAL